jgi:hypothetical protein
MQEINYEPIKRQKSSAKRLNEAAKEIDRVGYVCLSDVLLNRENGSSNILRVLDLQEKKGKIRTYKLRVLKDQNGNEVKKGHVVKWKQQIYNRAPGGGVKGEGDKLGQDKINMMRRRGQGDMFIDIGTAEVDSDGCITVPYRDAAMLLSRHGRHYETHLGITDMAELSSRPYPIKDKTGKVVGHKHRHNWLYEEVIPKESK